MGLRTLFLTIAIAAMSCTPALGDLSHVMAGDSPATGFTLVHSSTEEYYDSGGTLINGCIGVGCPGGGMGSFGDISGNVLWQVQEKVFYNPCTEQTKVSYTVFNDTFAGQLITSFHVPTGGATILGVTAPTGWSYTHMGNMVWWESTDPTTIGVPQFQSLDTMIITYDGILPVVFGSPVLVDLDGNAPFTMSDWVVTSVPLPGAAVLGAVGLGLVAWMRKRL